uniref:Uncharacterized protein n=1 Tax=Anopheles funestus TaxID=62324 RepID=A0A182RZU7_ANOFN
MAVSKQLGLVLLVVFAVVVCPANAIRCYTCNSNDNSECLQPPTSFTDEEYRDNRSVPARLLVECPPDKQGREAFCRKMNLLVIGGSVPDHTRIIRECGYERGRRPCVGMDNGGHEEYVCQCFTDACNEGSRITIAGMLLVLIPTGLLLVL